MLNSWKQKFINISVWMNKIIKFHLKHNLFLNSSILSIYNKKISFIAQNKYKIPHNYKLNDLEIQKRHRISKYFIHFLPTDNWIWILLTWKSCKNISIRSGLNLFNDLGNIAWHIRKIEMSWIINIEGMLANCRCNECVLITLYQWKRKIRWVVSHWFISLE